MSWAEQKLSFENLITQYVDIGGSPDDAEAWDAEDLAYLKSLIEKELLRRHLKGCDFHVWGRTRDCTCVAIQGSSSATESP